ncbi:MAG: protein sorting system archaetidylserine decarboxylase [Haloarculaceae archaeon]
MRVAFAPGTWRYVAPLVVGGLFALPLSLVLGAALLAAALATLAFHRDPDRQPPAEGVLAPADGRVSVVRREGDRLRVGVFMNVTDVHVNRAPLSGTVESVTHSPGAHRPAFSKDSDRNEKVHVDFGDFVVVLIAGAFARRIHPYVAAGANVDRGERIGHISFGSRVDVVMPADVGRADLRVERGDAVVAGETVLAER